MSDVAESAAEIRTNSVPLPVSADGLPINIGDTIYRFQDGPLRWHQMKVSEMTLTDSR